MEYRLLPKQQIPPLHIAEMVQWKGKVVPATSQELPERHELPPGLWLRIFASRLTPEAFPIGGYSHKAVEV